MLLLFHCCYFCRHRSRRRRRRLTVAAEIVHLILDRKIRMRVGPDNIYRISRKCVATSKRQRRGRIERDGRIKSRKSTFVSVGRPDEKIEGWNSANWCGWRKETYRRNVGSRLDHYWWTPLVGPSGCSVMIRSKRELVGVVKILLENNDTNYAKARLQYWYRVNLRKHPVSRVTKTKTKTKKRKTVQIFYGLPDEDIDGWNPRNWINWRKETRRRSGGSRMDHYWWTPPVRPSGDRLQIRSKKELTGVVKILLENKDSNYARARAQFRYRTRLLE